MIVGVIGGGQLARMMIPAAVNLGIELRVFAENEGESAAFGHHHGRGLPKCARKSLRLRRGSTW